MDFRSFEVWGTFVFGGEDVNMSGDSARGA